VLKIYCALSAECAPDRAHSTKVPSAALHRVWSSSQHSFGQLKICQPSNPTNFGLVFRSPQTLRVFGEYMRNISVTRGHPDMRFCVYGSPRGDLSHIAGLTNGRSRSDFSGVEMESLQFVGCSWFMGLIGLVFRFTQNKFIETDYV
jgi:hypothetical protein